jgi:hypothetical protein
MYMSATTPNIPMESPSIAMLTINIPMPTIATENPVMHHQRELGFLK